MPTKPGPEKAAISGDITVADLASGIGLTPSDVLPEDLLQDGEVFHGEPKYKCDELYMIGRPYDSIYRFPVFDSAFQSPMEYAVAIDAMAVLRADNLNELPSLRYRLYRVSIEAV